MIAASNPWPASFPAWPALYILSKPYKAARGVSYGTIPVIQTRMEGVTMKDWGNISIRKRFKYKLVGGRPDCTSSQGRVEKDKFRAQSCGGGGGGLIQS